MQKQQIGKIMCFFSDKDVHNKYMWSVTLLLLTKRLYFAPNTFGLLYVNGNIWGEICSQ